MTALTFPRALPDQIVGGGWSFQLEPTIEVTPLRAGRQISADLGPALWRAHYETAELREPSLGIVRSWYDTLLSLETFEAWDRARPYPLAYSSFSGLTKASGGSFTGTAVLIDVASNQVEADIVGLPSGFVLSVGDMLSFDYGASSSRALHRIVKAVNANGSGEVTVEVRPAIRVGWAVGGSPDPGRTVHFYRPAALMIILPGSYQERLRHPRRGAISFDAIQSL